jgi:hypothetical protein
VTRASWHRATIGAGIWRLTSSGALVTVRPAWDGGVRVTIARESGGIYRTTHARRFGGAA